LDPAALVGPLDHILDTKADKEVADRTETEADNTWMQREVRAVVAVVAVVAGNFHTLDNTDDTPSLLDTVEK
jgi:hypothetical protein